MNKKKIEILQQKLLEAIRKHMEGNNITQEEVAEKTGFIQSNVSRMLAGKYSPTLDKLLMLCEAVGTRLEIRSILYKQPTDEG